MYQNILQQLQQMFSGSANRRAMQPGGISDMMYRMPREPRPPSFIDGLVGGTPGVFPGSIGGPGLGGELPPSNPGTIGVDNPEPGNGGMRPLPTEPGGPMYPQMPPLNVGHIPGGGGMPGAIGGGTSVSAHPVQPGGGSWIGGGSPGGERPGTYGVNLGNPPAFRNIPPRLQGNPGAGGARPMPMPTPGNSFKLPEIPRQMPRPPSGATPAPMGGMPRRVTGGY